MKKKPTLTLFCGLPGSGKTTLAKRLEQQGMGLRICTDDWQEDLGMNHDDNAFHEKLQRKLYELALELLENGQDVILEDGLWTKSEREEKLSDGKKHGGNVELYFFDLTFEEIWRRLELRNSELEHGAVHIPKQELEKCWDIFQKPNQEELASFDKFTVIDDETKLL